MSEDRNNGIGDPAVSDAYRDMATERAPASLNEAVLHDAAAHASKGYARSMLWMRPLAYAATVMLSLAIVIQVVLPPNADVQVPAERSSPAAGAAEPVPNAQPVSADDSTREQNPDDDPLKWLRDQETREESKIEGFVVAPAGDVPAVASDAAPSVAAEIVQEFPDVGPGIDDNALAESGDAAVTAHRLRQPETESFEGAALSSESAIQQAGDMAAMRAVQPDDYNAAFGLSASVAGSVCEPEDLESPEAWADCIERLEDDGRADEAHAERLLLTEAFPEFEWPAE